MLFCNLFIEQPHIIILLQSPLFSHSRIKA